MEKIEKMEFMHRIKQLRQDKGLTQANLAKKFNKTVNAIGMWECGKAKPDVDTLIKLSQYFDCTTDYLLGLSIDKNLEMLDFDNPFLMELKRLFDMIPLELKPALERSIETAIDYTKRIGGQRAKRGLQRLSDLLFNFGRMSMNIIEMGIDFKVAQTRQEQDRMEKSNRYLFLENIDACITAIQEHKNELYEAYERSKMRFGLYDYGEDEEQEE